MLPQQSQQLCVKTVFHKPYNHKTSTTKNKLQVGKKLFSCGCASSVGSLVLVIIITTQ